MRNLSPQAPPAVLPAPPPGPPPDVRRAASSDSTAATAATGTRGPGKADRNAIMAETRAGGGMDGGNSEPVSRHLNASTTQRSQNIGRCCYMGEGRMGRDGLGWVGGGGGRCLRRTCHARAGIPSSTDARTSTRIKYCCCLNDVSPPPHTLQPSVGR